MRTIFILLAVWHGANGIVMLVAPDAWYAFVPGVTDTGPANTHFVRDIGLAFIASAACLLGAARTQATIALLAPAIFLGGHAGLHLVEMFGHGTTTTDALRDTALILVPGVLPFALLRWPFEGRTAR